MFICKELTLHFFCHHCLGLVHHHEITLFRHLQLLEITVNLASFFTGAALHLICMYVCMYACLLCQYLYSYNILYIYICMFYTIVAVVLPCIEIINSPLYYNIPLQLPVDKKITFVSCTNICGLK